ncbi:AAA family ATPase [[Acholeplasma] multilocale]|uniref:AAA family ATPase n=1 Tax=[Acholeplasma] multilocale TaxID=264638 RepID=UPI00047BC0AC|nr:AAA family ATPase [[Acholeplasma] multilocale]
MLFLKQIRAYGFKSFAEPTTLDFTHEMIGVVGPNGSGKSNITDAIRWTLGEQSTKSLRGANMDDIVFSGSSDKKAADFAEVTLVFNNQKDIFSGYDTDIVEITRKFVKKTRESEFYINGQRVKLRDIQDAALETGLTKSSIAIISQGTISSFAEAKPEDRRNIFDEAAGVAKYKKRKRETLSKLLKGMENLARVEDISNEIARRLPNLERQAKKAELYKEKIEELQQIEVSILVKDIKTIKVRIEELRANKNTLEGKIKNLSNEINLSQDEFDGMMNDTSNSEKEIQQLNNKFQEIVQRIANLKVKKQEVDARETSKLDTKDQDEFKAGQIKKAFDEKRVVVSSEKDKVFRYKNQITEINEKYDYVASQYSNIYDEIETIRRNSTRVQMQKEHAENQRGMGAMAYNDGGAVVVEHSNTIGGVIGTLISLVNVQEDFQTAISVVAAGSMKSVVMKTNNDVKRAVEFLKKNNAGRATFLPLDSLNPSTIQGPQRSAIESARGFVGFANDLVSIDGKYQKALDYALGTVIVMDKYDSARELAQNINYKFNIVTLEGERFLPKGAIVGGKTKNQNIFAGQNKQANTIEDFERVIQQLEAKEIERTKLLNEVKIERDKLRDEQNDIQANIRNTNLNIEQLTNALNELSEDYRILTGRNLLGQQEDDSNESESIKIAKQIAKLENERDEIQIRINQLSTERNKHADRQREINELNSGKRNELSDLKDEYAKASSELNVLQERFMMSLKRLAEGYGLTAEAALEMETTVIENEAYARERIVTLATELKEIGNINMDSIEEFKAEKERYDYFEVQVKDIREAIEKLQNIITDIDIAMETQFKKVVDDVNDALPEAFAKLFGGGTARLIYTDPDNILETGIDIQVNPPGKKISNLNLLSGGEKSLVALSVLFSILKVRPLPLVILDEAEAPLDPANVERFARYVKQFTENTQFIIVTHREGTMENCDVLFGVTMETKGITKIVKIKLVDAKELTIKENQA